MSFESDLRKFEDKANKQVDAARRQGVLDLFSAVIRDTPVDTGRAVGNWQTSVGAIKTDILDRFGESEARAELLEVLDQWGDDETIYIQNNLPYIERLEDGYSKKSPAGMVAKNVKRFEPLIKAAAAKAKK